MADPVVLVTGGAKRVGAAIVRAMHASGAVVVIHCRRSTAEAESLARELDAERRGSTHVVAQDLLFTDALPSLVEAVTSRFGRLDVLVNCASTFFATPVGAITGNAFADLIGTNLKAPLFLSQAAAPALAASGGCIVNIVDIHAERPLAGYLVYSIAKAGLAALTRSLSRELGPAVRVNGVAPGAVMWPEDTGHFPPAEQRAIIQHSSLKRAGTPQDIAHTVRFLAFDAPYITGQIIAVDGGRSVNI